MMAQETALKKNKKVEVMWRGYKDSVEPSEPVFTALDLERRLITALNEILNIHDIVKFPKKEEKVSYCQFHQYWKIIKNTLFVTGISKT